MASSVNMNDLLLAAEKVHTKLFGAPNKEVRSFANGACKGIDVAGFRFITQNPNTSSKFAQMARSGQKISWVIHLQTNKWMVRVVDGKAEAL